MKTTNSAYRLEDGDVEVICEGEQNFTSIQMFLGSGFFGRPAVTRNSPLRGIPFEILEPEMIKTNGRRQVLYRYDLAAITARPTGPEMNLIKNLFGRIVHDKLENRLHCLQQKMMSAMRHDHVAEA